MFFVFQSNVLNSLKSAIQLFWFDQCFRKNISPSLNLFFFLLFWNPHDNVNFRKLIFAIHCFHFLDGFFGSDTQNWHFFLKLHTIIWFPPEGSVRQTNSLFDNYCENIFNRVPKYALLLFAYWLRSKLVVSHVYYDHE